MSLRSIFHAAGAAIIVTLAAITPAAASPLVLGPVASTEYAEAFPIHGIGGDEKLIFALQPTDVPHHPRGIYVSHRLGGAHLGAVTPPAAGWSAPVAMKVADYHNVGLFGSKGSFVILDAFPPAEVGTRPGIVYEYSYSYTPAEGLATTLTGTHPLPLFSGFDATGLPNGPAYPISMARLPTGHVVVVDMIFGGVWVSGKTLDDWTLGIVDPRFEAGELDAPIQGIGRGPNGGTRAYSFESAPAPPFFPFPILPGLHGVTYCEPTDEVAVLRTATPGGIYGIAAAALFDTKIAANAKGAAVREIAAPDPGVTDVAAGLDYDRFHPDTPWVYWQRAPANVSTGFNAMYRVNLFTGVIEKLTESLVYYNWTNELSVLPSTLGPDFTMITNANMQEENVPESNALLNGVATLVGPTIVPLVAFSNW